MPIPGNLGYEARALDGGELCSNGTVVKTIYEGDITLVPESEVYTAEPDARTQTNVVEEEEDLWAASIPGQKPSGGDYLTSQVALGIGSTPQNVATSAFSFEIDGVRATKAAVAAGTAFTATTHDIADPDANPREAIFVLSVAANGTITITKGADAAAGAAVAPATPAANAKIGEVKIQHNGSAIFDATTDSLAAAHLTVTYTPNHAFTV